MDKSSESQSIKLPDNLSYQSQEGSKSHSTMPQSHSWQAGNATLSRPNKPSSVISNELDADNSTSTKLLVQLQGLISEIEGVLTEGASTQFVEILTILRRNVVSIKTLHAEAEDIMQKAREAAAQLNTKSLHLKAEVESLEETRRQLNCNIHDKSVEATSIEKQVQSLKIMMNEKKSALQAEIDSKQAELNQSRRIIEERNESSVQLEDSMKNFKIQEKIWKEHEVRYHKSMNECSAAHVELYNARKAFQNTQNTVKTEQKTLCDSVADLENTLLKIDPDYNLSATPDSMLQLTKICQALQTRFSSLEKSLKEQEKLQEITEKRREFTEQQKQSAEQEYKQNEKKSAEQIEKIEALEEDMQVLMSHMKASQKQCESSDTINAKLQEKLKTAIERNKAQINRINVLTEELQGAKRNLERGERYATEVGAGKLEMEKRLEELLKFEDKYLQESSEVALLREQVVAEKKERIRSEEIVTKYRGKYEAQRTELQALRKAETEGIERLAIGGEKKLFLEGQYKELRERVDAREEEAHAARKKFHQEVLKHASEAIQIERLKQEVIDLQDWKSSKEDALIESRVAAVTVQNLEASLATANELNKALKIKVEALEEHSTVCNDQKAAQDQALVNAEQISEFRQRSIITMSRTVGILRGIQDHNRSTDRTAQAELAMFDAIQELALLRLGAMNVSDISLQDSRSTRSSSLYTGQGGGQGPVNRALADSSSGLESLVTGQGISRKRKEPPESLSIPTQRPNPQENTRSADASSSAALGSQLPTGASTIAPSQLANETLDSPGRRGTKTRSARTNARPDDYPSPSRAGEAARVKLSDLRNKTWAPTVPQVVQETLAARFVYLSSRSKKWDTEVSKIDVRCLERAAIRLKSNWDTNPDGTLDFYHSCNTCVSARRICAVLLDDGEAMILPLPASKRDVLYTDTSTIITSRDPEYWLGPEK